MKYGGEVQLLSQIEIFNVNIKKYRSKLTNRRKIHRECADHSVNK